MIIDHGENILIEAADAKDLVDQLMHVSFTEGAARELARLAEPPSTT